MPKEREVKVSPWGVASYPHLSVPSTKFDKEGKYEVDLVLDPADPEVVAFIEAIETFRDAERPGGNVPIHEQVDRKTKVATGMLTVKFRSNYRPAIFDAKKNPIPPEINVGQGSVIRVAYVFNDYEPKKDLPKGGINLYLQRVQVKQLVESHGMDGDCFEEADGYEVEDSQKPTAFDGGGTNTGGTQPAGKTEAAKGVPSHALDAVLKEQGIYEKVVEHQVPTAELEKMWADCKQKPIMFKLRVNTWINQKVKGG